MRSTLKLLFISVLLLLISAACNNDHGSNNSDDKISAEDVNNPKSASKKEDMKSLPEFDFPVKEYNFGTVIQGEKVSYTFTFENTGGSDLIIKNVKASCGCTTPKWTKKPIKPGKEGNIEVIFDSHGRKGEQRKTVRVFANTQPNTAELRIFCNIVT